MAINDELMKICDTIEAMVKDINDRVNQMTKEAEAIKRYMGVSKCPACGGSGWTMVNVGEDCDHDECMNCQGKGVVKNAD